MGTFPEYLLWCVPVADVSTEHSCRGRLVVYHCRVPKWVRCRVLFMLYLLRRTQLGILVEDVLCCTLCRDPKWVRCRVLVVCSCSGCLNSAFLSRMSCAVPFAEFLNGYRFAEDLLWCVPVPDVSIRHSCRGRLVVYPLQRSQMGIGLTRTFCGVYMLRMSQFVSLVEDVLWCTLCGVPRWVLLEEDFLWFYSVYIYIYV